MKELVICRHRPGADDTTKTVLTVRLKDGSVAATDDQLSAVLGYTGNELKGRPLQQLIASPEDNPLCPDYASYHDSGRPLSVTLRHSQGYFIAARVIVRPVSKQLIRKNTASPKQNIGPAKAAPATVNDIALQSRREEIAHTKAMLAHIRQCLSQGGLPLEYQAIQSFDGRKSGVMLEILARLQRRDSQTGAAMTPGEFLPLIERFELSRRLDRQVIRQTLGYLYQRPELASQLSYCGFNLSLGSLQDPTLADFIGQALEKTGLPSHSLCFEIPAALAISQTSSCRHTSRRLRALGCRTALDGAGLSMASYRLASRFPADYIKLAPELMERIHEDPTHLVMIEALQRIATGTGKQLIAAGVRNDIARHRVQGLGVTLIQGHMISEPRPLEQLRLETSRDAPTTTTA